MFFMDRTLILDSHTPLLLTLSGSQNSQVGSKWVPDPLGTHSIWATITGYYEVTNGFILLLVIISAQLNRKSSKIFELKVPESIFPAEFRKSWWDTGFTNISKHCQTVRFEICGCSFDSNEHLWSLRVVWSRWGHCSNPESEFSESYRVAPEWFPGTTSGTTQNS